MADYAQVKRFLTENNVTDEQMDAMWSAMYNQNALVKVLTDHGKNWLDLNNGARKSLIRIYNESQIAVTEIKVVEKNE